MHQRQVQLGWALVLAEAQVLVLALVLALALAQDLVLKEEQKSNSKL